MNPSNQNYDNTNQGTEETKTKLLRITACSGLCTYKFPNPGYRGF